MEVVEEIDGTIGFNANLVEDNLAAYSKYIVVDPADAKTAHTNEAQRRAQSDTLR